MPKERPIDPQVIETFKAIIPAGFKFGELSKAPSQSGLRKCDLSTVQFLETLKVDLVNDICGQMRPVLSVNYVVALARFMLLFMQIEEKLKNRQNPSWVQAYEGHSAMTQEKRLSLTAIALTERDEECMQVMADAFQSPRDGFMNYVYWDGLQSHGELGKGDHDPLGPDACAVM